ncbi:hypothetical protein SLE2022_341580 [Rubroshorea leprosula]
MPEENSSVPNRKRRCCLIIGGVVLLCLILFSVIVLILALTVFKVKEPRSQLLSTAIRGVAPSFYSRQLNITIDLKLRIENRNRASFRHGTGKTLLLYQGNQVGETDIYPGAIPAMGSTDLSCLLTLQVDKIASNIEAMMQDVFDGEIEMETQARIPGRVTLWFIKKHIIAKSDCRLTIAVPTFNVQKQTCKTTAKL